jgi:PPM family protein phosphatase
VSYEFDNAQHIGARTEQQDAFRFSDPGDEATVSHAGVLGVLSDGMGGLNHGAAMAQAAVQGFFEGYRGKTAAEAIPAALSRAMSHANRAVVALAQQIGCEGAAGATLVAAVLHRDRLFWISAGDSRAYLIRQGRAFRLTVDHNVGEDAARGLSTPGHSGSSDPPAAATLTSFLGAPSTPRVDANCWPFPLAQGDVVLLASDGLYQALSEPEIASTVGGGAGSVRGVCDRLVRAACDRAVDGQDNVTVMAMHVRRSSDATRAVPSRAVPSRSSATMPRARSRWRYLLLGVVLVDLLLVAALFLLLMRAFIGNEDDSNGSRRAPVVGARPK